MTREELIQELDNSGCPVCRDCHILESVDKYIKSEKRLLLEKIGRPLKEGEEWSKKFTYNPAVDHWKKLYKAIDDTLAIIEKESV